MKIAEARVLVTGASSGIGAALARLSIARGAQVLATGRDAEALTRLGRVRALPLDLTEPGAVARLCDWAGEVDVLIGNAGLGYAGEFTDMPVERIAELITLNQTVNVELTHRLLPGMLSRGDGAIAFVSSIAGAMAVAEEAVYSSAKAGLRTFADSVRLSVAGYGVSVTTVFPGVVDTPFFERRGAAYDRSRPRPVPPRRVAAATLRGIERGSAEVFVPAWLRFPARLHGGLPGLVRGLRTVFE